MVRIWTLNTLVVFLVLLVGCGRSAPLPAPNTAGTKVAPAPIDPTPPPILSRLPTDIAAVVVVHDPLDLANALGREPLMEHHRALYEELSAEFLGKLGANPLHPDGWEQLGLDPRASAGAVLLDSDGGDGFLLFATLTSPERLKAAAYAFAEREGVSIEHRVVGSFVALSFERREMALLIDDGIALLVHDRHDLDSAVDKLTGLADAQSLATDTKVLQALQDVGRGEDALIIAAPRCALQALAPSFRRADAERLLPMHSWWVAATRVTKAGLVADWRLPLSDDSPWRSILVPREEAGLGYHARQVPLQALDVGVDPEAFHRYVEELRAPSETIAAAGLLARALKGDVSWMVGREFLDRMRQSQSIADSGFVVQAEASVRSQVAVRNLVDFLRGWAPRGQEIIQPQGGNYLLRSEFFNGTVEISDTTLRVISDGSASPHAGGPEAWQHPHAELLKRLLDSRGAVFTYAHDHTLTRLLNFTIPLPLPLDLPRRARADDPGAQERLDQALMDDADYVAAREEVRAAEEAVMSLQMQYFKKLALSQIAAERPSRIWALRGTLQREGLAGQVAMIVNLSDVRQWGSALMSYEKKLHEQAELMTRALQATEGDPQVEPIPGYAAARQRLDAAKAREAAEWSRVTQALEPH